LEVVTIASLSGLRQKQQRVVVYSEKKRVNADYYKERMHCYSHGG